ncbi:MAG: hypothetical protein ABR592_09695 [Nitriliruptorales bacterium]
MPTCNSSCVDCEGAATSTSYDHLEAAGLTVLTAMGADAPPVLHTLHWDLCKHPGLYDTFDGGGRVFVNGVSASQLARAPEALRRHSVGHSPRDAAR